MAFNATIEPPDSDRIKKESGIATADAIDLIWQVLNQEMRDRRSGVKQAIDQFEPKSVVDSPAAGQNDYDTRDATILRFDGATSFNLTGLRARPENAIVIILVLGVGTVTIKNSSASSEANNRILTQSGGDLAVATNKAVMLIYESSRWREAKWA
jgi:hypothetical protein